MLNLINKLILLILILIILYQYFLNNSYILIKIYIDLFITNFTIIKI